MPIIPIVLPGIKGGIPFYPIFLPLNIKTFISNHFYSFTIVQFIISEQILYRTTGTSGIAKLTQKDLLSLIK